MLEKTYRPDTVEAKHYRRWEDAGAFACGRRPTSLPYTIVIPPPNVTGSLHIGHALNNTLQDVLVRMARMRGRDALWQPGMDHAGIATQMVVERTLEAEGTTRRELGREAFVERVWQWKESSGGAIANQLKRLGASCDWSRERFTMDEGLSRAVREVFVALHREGLIYKDKRLVNWDCALHTAISDLEVQQRPVSGSLWHIKYPVEGAEKKYIIVATTRPETMLGDTAIAVHPDDARYAEMVGTHAILPLVGRRLPIVADQHADPEAGSGAVKITPAHDFNDFEVGRRHGLEAVNIFDERARLNDNAPEVYRGMDRFDARARIVADLEAQGLIARIEPHEHTLPYGDRSDTVIEPWLTVQWYADAAALAGPAIAAVEDGRTKFVPRRWEKTYFEWMRNIQPWCISRQLWWGHRIPAWTGPDGHIFVEMTEDDAHAAAAVHYGEGVPLTRDPDVLDTWFSSALWPFSTLGWPDQAPEVKRYYPTDDLVTSFDIIFFWVARMMMMGLKFMGEVPFRTVYIHALVRDEHGQKMSKSKGNVIDPLDLIERFGADALRFTLTAMAAQGRDINVSESRIEGYRNFGTKLWNAARFCQMNECAVPPEFDPAACAETVNRWIVGEATRTAERVTAEIEAYRFNEAATALYQFAWGTFCDWYLEAIKPVLLGADGAEKDETRAAAGWVLDTLLHLLHPIMPFLTEELWQELAPRDNALLATSPWPEPGPELLDGDAAAEMDWVIRLVGQVRTVRAEMNVPAGARIPAALVGALDENAERLARHGALIARLAKLDLGADEADEADAAGAVRLVHDEASLVLDLAGIVELDAERARLGRELDRLAGDIAKIDNKLGDKRFVERAPAHVQETQRERRAEAEAARQKITAALERIAAGG
jgi:valyl-tRNA synthetase